MNFSIAKEDAIGFSLFAIALAAPVGFLAFLWGLIEESLPFGSSYLLLAYSIYKNKRLYMYFYISILVMSELLNYIWFYIKVETFEGYQLLSPEVAFILAFYSIGFGIYRFFSLFVNYRFSVNSECLGCNKLTSILEVPNNK